MCEAGVYKVGVGNLIGLEDWRTEAFFTALHVRYLENRYWRTKYSIAFPRLRPYYGEDGFNPEHPTTERNLLQLICAYRLLSEDVELSISTRESAACRDTVMPFGVTVMSAGSKTTPGGYAHPIDELEQWAVNDSRTPARCSTPSGPKGSSPCGRIGRFSCRKRIFPRKFCYICHSRAKLRTVFRRGWTLSHPSIPRSGLSAVFRGGGPREGTCEY